MNKINLINAQELHAWLKSERECFLVDVRDIEEYQLCRIEESRHIPLFSIQNIIDYYDLTHPIVFYCHHGMRSERAAMWALGMGFQSIYTLTGGIDVWAQVIEPDMVRY